MDNNVLIPVKVVLRAKADQIVGWENDKLKIRLNAIPEKGKANKALISLLSKTLKIPASQISIVQGTTSQHKTVCFSNLSPEQNKHLHSLQP